MGKPGILYALAVAAGIVLGSQSASAHCDSVDGPVAKAAQMSLETGNLYPTLAYAPETAEAEIRAAFERSRKVRGLGADARALADQAFMETVIRLHRAGEGAPYTGLKPAGIDYGPVIPAAEQSVEAGDGTKLKAVLVEEIGHALDERLAHLRELQNVPLEPSTEAQVPRSRERISAELGFITYAQTVYQAVLGKGTDHHAE